MKITCPHCGQRLKIRDEQATRPVRCARCKKTFTPDAPPPEADDLLALAGGDDIPVGPPPLDDFDVADDESPPGPSAAAPAGPVRRPGEPEIPAGEPEDLYGVSHAPEAPTEMPSPTGSLAPEMQWVVWLNSGVATLFWLGGLCLLIVGLSGYGLSLPMVAACLTGLTLAWIGKILFTSATLLKTADPAWHRLNLYLPLAWAAGLLALGLLLHQGAESNFYQHGLGKVFGISYVLLLCALLVGIYTVWVVHVRQPYRFISSRKGRVEVIPVHMMVLAMLAVGSAGSTAFLEMQTFEPSGDQRAADAAHPSAASPGASAPTPGQAPQPAPALASASRWVLSDQPVPDENDWFEMRGPGGWTLTKRSTGESSWLAWQDRPTSPTTILEAGCMGEVLSEGALMRVGEARLRPDAERQPTELPQGRGTRAIGSLIGTQGDAVVTIVDSAQTKRKLVFRLRCPAEQFIDTQRRFNEAISTFQELTVAHNLDTEPWESDWLTFRYPADWHPQEKPPDDAGGYRAEFSHRARVQVGVYAVSDANVTESGIDVFGRPIKELVPRTGLNVQTKAGQRWQYREGAADDAEGKFRLAALETTSGDRRYVVYLKALLLDFPQEREFLRTWVHTMELPKPVKVAKAPVAPKPKPKPKPKPEMSARDLEKMAEMASKLKAFGKYDLDDLPGQRGTAIGHHLSEDGKHLYIGLADRSTSVVALDVRTGSVVASASTPSRATAMLVCPDRDRVVLARHGGHLMAFSLSRFRKEFKGKRPTGGAHAPPGGPAHMPPAGPPTGTGRKSVQQGQIERVLSPVGMKAGFEAIDAIALAPDGKSMVVVGRTDIPHGGGRRPHGRRSARAVRSQGTPSVEYWQVDPMRRLKEIKVPVVGKVSQVGFDPSGKVLAIASEGRLLSLVDWTTKKAHRRKIATAGKTVAAFHFGARHLAVANGMSFVSLYPYSGDMEVRLPKKLTFLRERISAVTLIDNGRYLCVGMARQVRIYNVAEGAWDEPVTVDTGPRVGTPTWMALLPGSERLLVCDRRGALVVVHLPYYGVQIGSAQQGGR